ncbi:MAG: hypothetical protein WAT91_02260, partial [Saprospiraceae bacterium]
GAGTSTTSLINSNTSGSTAVTLSAGSNITLSEVGNTITIASTGGDGNGLWSASNDNSNIANSAFEVGVPGYLDFRDGAEHDLYIDASNDRIGMGTNSPSYGIHIKNDAGMMLEPISANVNQVFHLKGTTDGAGATIDQADLLFSYTDADYSASEQPAANIILGKQSDLSQWTTLKTTMVENTDADVFVAEKQAALSGNTTQSHVAINAGLAFTQNVDLTTETVLDRSYYTVNMTGGLVTDTLKLPEVGSTSDNWDNALSTNQVQVGQEFMISNFRSGVNVIISAFNGSGTTNDDLINTQTVPGGSAGSAITLVPGDAVIVKCIRYNGTIGYWATANRGDAFKGNPLSQFASTTSSQFLGVISDETGAGKVVGNDSPVFLDDLTVGTTGSATGVFYIKGTTSGTAALTVNAAAGSPTITLGTVSGTVAITGDKLSAFAATSSSELASVISDETGTNKLVYSASPALTGVPTAPTASLNTNTTQIATTAYVDSKIFTATLSGDHTISSTTATQVSCGASGISAGTYVFQYYILAQSATAGVSPMFGINFTGTSTVKAFKLRYPDTGTAATNGVADDDGSTAGQIEGSDAESAFTTTAPNMGATGGVATTGTNILYIIEGLLVATTSGDLQLFHGSETASSTTVKAGTSLILTKTN